MPKNNFNLDGANNLTLEQNDNRGQNTPEPRGGKEVADSGLDTFLSSNKARLPDYVDAYLSEENPSVRERLTTIVAKFRRNPQSYFENNPADLEVVRSIFREAQSRQELRERAENEFVGFILEEDTIEYKRTLLMRMGVILRGDETIEELDERIQLERRSRQRRRREAQERREVEERQEAFEQGDFDVILDRLDEGQLRGSYDLPQEFGRPRKILCRRQVGNTELDPITRLYNIATPFVADQTEDIYTRERMNVGQKVVFNKYLTSERRRLGFGPPNLPYEGDGNQIAFERVIWSYGGYQNPQMDVVTLNSAAVRGDTNRKLKWDSCWTRNGDTFTPVNEDNIVEEQTRDLTNQRSHPVLMYQTSAGDIFGQKDVLNFPVSMNALADNAYPKVSLQVFTELVTSGRTLSNNADSRIRKERMLDIVGYNGNLTTYNRDYDGAGFLQGMEFYNTLLRNFPTSGLKIEQVRFAALKPEQAQQISKNTFVSYEFYNFTAHTGEARDLYGGLISETEGAPRAPNDVFGYLDPEYNYYSEQYESAIAGSNIPHLLLPNFYTYILASNTVLPSLDQGQDGPPRFFGGERESTIRTQAVQQITLGEFSENILPSAGSNDENMADYLQRYATAVQGGVATNLSSQLNRLFSNIGLPADEVDIFDRLNARAHSFPMFIKIGVPTGPIGDIGKIIERTGTSTSMMNALLASSGTPERFNIRTQGYESPTPSDDPFDIDIPQNNPERSEIAISSDVVIYDFDDWINQVQSTTNTLATLRQNVDTGRYRAGGERIPSELLTLTDEHYIGNLKLAVAAKARDVTISYSKLLNNQPARALKDIDCYSETFMYKLRKHTVNQDNTIQLINEFYFPNTELSRIIEYVDTQVKYGETYHYELLGYDIVFGSEFRFRTDAYNASAGGWSESTYYTRPLYYSFNVETVPSLKVAEYPIFSRRFNDDNLVQDVTVGGLSYPNVAIVDRPPVPPTVFIHPYKDNYRQVMMNFQSMTDSFTTEYIVLQDNEEEIFSSISKLQKTQEDYKLQRGQVQFRNEGVEEIQRIEIYRSEEINSSSTSMQELYDSFRNKLHATVNISDGLDIIDTLNPNVTYYYTFRSIDRHNQPSNPSQIYEITLTYSSGVFIPRIDIYQPEKSLIENKKPAKKMSRFIEIKGADIQTMVNEERGTGFELVSSEKGFVPDQENKITTNKFLIRLTSKDSGRKISFLVDFKER